jgi:hypothetical protein
MHLHCPVRPSAQRRWPVGRPKRTDWPDCSEPEEVGGEGRTVQARQQQEWFLFVVVFVSFREKCAGGDMETNERRQSEDANQPPD